jgi:hypothetical protein
MDPSEGFEFDFAGGHYEVRPAVLVTGGREILEWFVLRDGRGLTTIPAVPGEPEEQIRVRMVRWLDEHLLEFRHRGVVYQVVRSEVPEDTRKRFSMLAAVPPFFWYVTRGPDYVTQFPGDPGESWQDAKLKVIQFVDSSTNDR